MATLPYSRNSSLRWLLATKENQQGRLARRVAEIQGYSFEVHHVPGKSIFVADTGICC